MTTPTNRAGRPARYPFGELRIGESFTVPSGKGQSVSASAYTWARRNNPKARFTVRDGQCIRLPDLN